MSVTRRLVAVSALVAVGLAPLQASETMRVASLRASSGAAAASAYVPGELIVQFRAGATDADMARVTREAGGARLRKSAFQRRAVVTLDDGFTVAEGMDRLRGRPEVEIVEPNVRFRASQTAIRVTPNDTLFQFQWHFEMIDATRTWAIQTGDSSVVVAVLDTGIAYENFGPFRRAPDFGTTTFVQGFDFINNDTHANDDNFHGTHVASVIAESTNNALGGSGLAYNTAIMPVKVLDEEGIGDTFSIAEGIDFAAEAPNVKVINMSLGGEGTSAVISAAVTRAVARGITVVAASGNENTSRSASPPTCPT